MIISSSRPCLDEKTQDGIQQIKRITWIGVGVNLILSISKFFLGVVGHSHAVVADAVHSLSDLVTDFAIIFGIKSWSKPPDDDHPYGHAKIETIVTAVIGIALVSVAVGIGYSALIALQKGRVEQPSWIALAGAVLSIILKEILYRWTLNVGKRVRSPAVMANAWHHRTDVLSSLPVAVAVAVAAINVRWSFLDQIGAFVVSIFILRVAWEILRSFIFEIVDTGASENHRKEIMDIVLSTDGVESSHALRTRRVGSGWYVDLHIQVSPEMTVKEGHDISTDVKNNLIEKGPDIFDVVVHLEPTE